MSSPQVGMSASGLSPNAVVDGRKPVTILFVDDVPKYSFVHNMLVPATPGIYLVQCPGGCQHYVAEHRITLLPEGDTPA